jgi:proteasome lid subunit RPN8/RPN11
MSRSKPARTRSLRGLVLTPHQLAAIVRQAEADYPHEACGLLIGRVGGRGVARIERVAPSPNLADGDHRDRFEVDPALRLRLERELRGSGAEIIGHYHSHPDHPARPSACDLAAAFEAELAWLIVAVERGEARAATAHQLARDGTGFRPLALKLAD